MSERKGHHTVCAVKSCFNKGYNSKKKFFRFPKDPNRARIWAMKANREELVTKLDDLHKSYMLCESHFEDRMFTNCLHTGLIASAYPTLFPSFERSSKAGIDEHSYSAPLLLPG